MSSEENQEPEEPEDISSDAEELEQAETSDAEKKDKSNSVKPTLEEKLSSKMLMYARETICFLLAVVFTALAAMHSSPPRISKPPIAKPFFNESSIVLDYYKGHLDALVAKVTESDYSFVMYYAPWDAECQAIKVEFENVARYYHSQVFFAAINCWHPGSECRIRYSKMQRYPVLMLYPSRESGVPYKGIRTAPYMIRFIHNFLNPIKRVRTDEQLMDLLKSYDAVMIGYFRFNGLKNTPGYKQFYKAALQTLEKDPNREVAFVVITSPETANNHGVTQFPAASLLMWNETLFYPDNLKWTAENLSNWLSNVMHRVVTWLQPPGSKSSMFASFLWDGPLLLLFTPRNPLHLENDNYNLLREIGLQYYDCSGNAQVTRLAGLLRRSRLSAAAEAHQRRQRCAELLEAEEQRSRKHRSYFAEMRSAQRRSNDSSGCCADVPTNKCVTCCHRGAAAEEQPDRMCAAPGAVCRGSDLFGMSFLLENACGAESLSPAYVGRDANRMEFEGSCAAKSCSENPSNEDNSDPYSAAAVKKAYLKEECRRFLTGYSYQRPIFPKDSDERSEEVTLTDMICRINKTLALVAIDSLHYFHFAENLGIDINRARDKTAVVIVDPSDESQFAMEEEFGRKAFVQFINNYTHGYLSRMMRSNNPKRFVRSLAVKSQCKKDAPSQICVPELSTDTFLTTVLDPDKDVVVMYHSPYCAFCSAVAYVYLTVAQYLSKMNHLEFVRIDGDNNDLPWEYTITRYPSILFFPARRKEESTLFPWTLPVTVGNLLSFVLANLEPEAHVEALLNLCGAAGVAGSPADCLARTRWLCLDVIEEQLRELRRLRRLRLLGVTGPEKRLLAHRRKQYLLRLGHMRQVHLLLGSCADLSKQKDKLNELRDMFQKFYEKLAYLRNCGKDEYCATESEEKQMKQRAS